MMFTGKDSKNADTMCRLSETYEGNVFIDFERRLAKERLRRPDDSHLTFHLTSPEDGRTLAEIQIFDDRIVLQGSTTRIVRQGSSTSTCAGEFVSAKGVRSWLRLRVHSVADVKKSIVTVAVQDKGHFSQCADIELDGTYSSHRLNLQGTTTIGMEQWVHAVTRASPVLTEKKTDLTVRMKVVEDRLARLESSVSEQSSSHGVRHRALQESHSQMEYALMVSRSLSHSSIKIHFIFNVALILAAILCILYYIKRWAETQVSKMRKSQHIL
jgi:hypothetical protein